MNILKIFIAVILVLLPGAIKPSPVYDGTEAEFIQQAKKALEYRRYSQLATLGKELEKYGDKNGRRTTAELGIAFRLNGEVMSYSSDSIDKTLAEALRVIESHPETDSSEALSYLCIAVASYYNMYDIDFSKATDFAFKALHHARSSHSLEAEIMALSSLAFIYCDRGDSTGMRWAKECENAAKTSGHKSAMYMTAANMASYLFKKGEYETAQRYIDKADSIITISGMEHERYYTAAFRGSLFNSLGDYQKADSCFKAALKNNPDHTPFDIWYANASYACFLNSRGRYDEAILYFDIACKAMEGYRLPGSAPYVYRKLSEALEATGKHRDALKAYQEFNRINTDRINSANEKAVKELEVKYHVAEQENINNKQKLELAVKDRVITVSVVTSIILVILAAAVTAIYIFKLRYYRRIVKVNISALEREKRLRHELSQALETSQAIMKNRENSLCDRYDDIYLKLISLMEHDRVYRNPDISLDTLAAMAGTNRTYLLRTIKQKTGMTYSAYINDLRINDAIEQLSSCESNDIVKTVAASVGFDSTSNFYRLFKLKTGVSPTVFRSQSTSPQAHNITE